MLPLDLLIDFQIVEPAVAVADDLVALRDKGLRQLRTLFERADDSEDADLDVKALENAHEPPGPAARSIFENRFDGGIAAPL